MKKYISLILVLSVFLSACGPVTPVPTEPDKSATPPSDLVIEWHREGGIAGFCDTVMVYANGIYLISNCSSKIVFQGELSALQSALMRHYINTYKNFEYEQKDRAVADSMSVSLKFYGQGIQKPSDDDIQTIFELMSDLMAQK